MAQKSDIPPRVINENSDIFGVFLLSSSNDAVAKSYFPTVLKQANIAPVFKKGERHSKDNYRSISILPNAKCVKIFLKNVCFVKCLFIWITFYPNTSTVSEKDITHNTVF